jgi:hypothetical protein
VGGLESRLRGWCAGPWQVRCMLWMGIVSQLFPIFHNRVLGYGAVVGVVLICTGDMSVEGFTCLLVFKNIFSFGLTFKGFEWMVQGGVKHVFVIIASVQVAICALTIPMCKSYLPRSVSS